MKLTEHKYLFISAQNMKSRNESDKKIDLKALNKIYKPIYINTYMFLYIYVYICKHS